MALPLTLSRGGVSLPIHGGGNGWKVLRGVQGLDTAVSDITEVDSSGLDGAFYGGLSVGPRDVYLPLQASAADPSTYPAMMQALRDITNPRLGTVRLTATGASSARWIDGYRVNRQAITWDGTSHGGVRRVGLTLRCEDPYWQAAAATIGAGVVGGQLWFPILPVTLVDASSLISTQTITSGGDAYTYPKVTITGPCASFTATHVASGRTWTLNLALSAGQSAVVDTDPRRTGLAVTGPSGASAFSSLAAPFDLWPLPPGNQSVSVLMPGTGTGSSWSMVATPRWESAEAAA